MNIESNSISTALQSAYAMGNFSSPQVAQRKENQSVDSDDYHSVVDKMRREVMDMEGSSKYIRDGNDGLGMLDSVDEGLSSLEDSLTKIKSLATQAGEDKLSTSERDDIQKEINELKEKIGATLEDSEYNGRSLFSQDSSTQYRTGDVKSSTFDVTLKDLREQFKTLDDLDIHDEDSRDQFLESVNDLQASIGTQREDYAEVRSNIADTMKGMQTSQSSQSSSDVSDPQKWGLEDALRISQQVRDQMFGSGGVQSIFGQANLSSTMLSSLLG